MTLSKEMEEFKAMYETLHKLEHISGERLYINTNEAGYMYLLSVSGKIIAQGSNTAALHNRMLLILITAQIGGVA